MNAWIQILLSILEYVPMILLSFVLFRQKIMLYAKEIALTSLVGGILGPFTGPFIYAAGLFALYCVFLKFRPIAALLIALSGYTFSVFISTGVTIICDKFGVVSNSAIQDNNLLFNFMVVLTCAAKLLAVSALHRFRWGFTFLAHYSKITFSKENLVLFGFMGIAIMGILFCDTIHASLLAGAMSIHTLSMATIFFIYMTLRKELGF